MTERFVRSIVCITSDCKADREEHYCFETIDFLLCESCKVKGCTGLLTPQEISWLWWKDQLVIGKQRINSVNKSLTVYPRSHFKLSVKLGAKEFCPDFIELQLLLDESRDIIKIMLVVIKCIHGICLENLISKLKFKKYHCPKGDHLTRETGKILTKFGCRTFQLAWPQVWNSLPMYLIKILWNTEDS